MEPLSREFLLSRGTCCGSGCKNCPYYIIHTKGSTEVFKPPDKVECPGKFVCSGTTMQKGDCICYLDYLGD